MTRKSVSRSSFLSLPSCACLYPTPFSWQSAKSRRDRFAMATPTAPADSIPDGVKMTARRTPRKYCFKCSFWIQFQLIQAKCPRCKGFTSYHNDRDLRHRGDAVPCSHSGTCDTEHCKCALSEVRCGKDCTCDEGCKRRFEYCRCENDERCQDCPCETAGRECDAEMCQCHADCANASIQEGGNALVKNKESAIIHAGDDSLLQTYEFVGEYTGWKLPIKAKVTGADYTFQTNRGNFLPSTYNYLRRILTILQIGRLMATTANSVISTTHNMAVRAAGSIVGHARTRSLPTPAHQRSRSARLSQTVRRRLRLWRVRMPRLRTS